LVAGHTRTRGIGGFDSTREGDKGDTSFIIILFTHIGFFLGEVVT
jgi:hypothetical protein